VTTSDRERWFAAAWGLEAIAAWPVLAFAFLLAFPFEHTLLPLPAADVSADIPLILGAPLAPVAGVPPPSGPQTSAIAARLAALPLLALVSEVLRSPFQLDWFYRDRSTNGLDGTEEEPAATVDQRLVSRLALVLS
jgi:hypothetical protein